MLAGRDAASLPGADEDYYADMDYGLTKNPEAIRASLDPYLPGISAADAVKRVAIGRNNWIVWTAGNDRLWDVLSVSSLGNLDLLKTISSHPVAAEQAASNRWRYLGLVNEPCFRKATGPRADRFGLWLDERVDGAGCGPDPFENEQKYPGVEVRRPRQEHPGRLVLRLRHGRRRSAPLPESELRRSGAEAMGPGALLHRQDLLQRCEAGEAVPRRHVVRLLPRRAESVQSAGRSGEPDLGESEQQSRRAVLLDRAHLHVRPGSGQLHLAALPHLASRRARHVAGLLRPDQQSAHDERDLQPRRASGDRTEVGTASNWPAAARTTSSSTTTSRPARALTKFYDPATQMANTTHVLKDGSDSVGALGALNRVYLNIGLFSEEWLLHFIPMVGGPNVSPIKIADAEKNSSYWKANERRRPTWRSSSSPPPSPTT